MQLIQNLIEQLETEFSSRFHGAHKDLFKTYLWKNAEHSIAQLTLETCHELSVNQKDTNLYCQLVILLNSWGDITDDLIDGDLALDAQSLLFQWIYEAEIWSWAKSIPNAREVLGPYISIMFQGQWEEKSTKNYAWEDYCSIVDKKSGLQLAVLGCLPLFLVNLESEYAKEDVVLVAKLYGLLVQLEQDIQDSDSILWSCECTQRQVHNTLLTLHNQVKTTSVPNSLYNATTASFHYFWNKYMTNSATVQAPWSQTTTENRATP